MPKIDWEKYRGWYIAQMPDRNNRFEGREGAIDKFTRRFVGGSKEQLLRRIRKVTKPFPEACCYKARKIACDCEVAWNCPTHGEGHSPEHN